MIDHAKKEYVDTFIVYGMSVCLVIVLSIVHLVTFHKAKTALVMPNMDTKTADVIFDKSVFTNIPVRAKAYVV